MSWTVVELLSSTHGAMSWVVVDSTSEVIIADCGPGEHGRRVAEQIVQDHGIKLE